MPIRPENKHRYHANWGKIRATILKRAKDRCEWCGRLNHVRVHVHEDGTWDFALETDDDPGVLTVLTIAHLDHRPENCHPANLAALCQWCHNRYDAKTRAAGRRERAQRTEKLPFDK